MKKITQNIKANTMMEIVISIIVLGVLASLALPNYQGAMEKVRSAEATQILQVLYSAQKSFLLENSAYTSTMANLDVTIPTPKNFNAPVLAAPAVGSNSPVAQMTRNVAGGYTLKIREDASLCCCVGSTAGMCTRIGVTTVCASCP